MASLKSLFINVLSSSTMFQHEIYIFPAKSMCECFCYFKTTSLTFTMMKRTFFECFSFTLDVEQFKCSQRHGDTASSSVAIHVIHFSFKLYMLHQVDYVWHSWLLCERTTLFFFRENVYEFNFLLSIQRYKMSITLLCKQQAVTID